MTRAEMVRRFAEGESVLDIAYTWSLTDHRARSRCRSEIVESAILAKKRKRPPGPRRHAKTCPRYGAGAYEPDYGDACTCGVSEKRLALRDRAKGGEGGVMPVPVHVLIPTCDWCGAEWMDDATARALAALEPPR